MFNKELIEKFKQIETPFYYYDVNLLRDSLSKLKHVAKKYDYTVHYALKANANGRSTGG